MNLVPYSLYKHIWWAMSYIRKYNYTGCIDEVLLRIKHLIAYFWESGLTLDFLPARGFTITRPKRKQQMPVEPRA